MLSKVACSGRKVVKMAEGGERALTDDGGSQDEKEDGRNDGPPRYINRGRNVEDTRVLYSNTLNIEKKVYYVDVKENRRGRFVQISESFNRSKMKIFVPLFLIGDFKEEFDMFSEFYATLGPHEPEEMENKNEEDRLSESLKSDKILKGKRRFYFDLKHNRRGYFLKINQPQPSFQQRRSLRLAIPGQGIVDIRNCLAKIVDEYGVDEDEEEAQLPEAKEVRVEHKRFYFDVGRNNRGVFVRLSEVTNNFRASVTIPRGGWEKLRDSLNDLCCKLPDSDQHGGGSDHQGSDEHHTGGDYE